MAQVETATGPLDTAALGTTLMHEHVFVLSAEIQANYDVGWDEEAEVANAVARLSALKSEGVDTVVDLTVVGLGRDVARVKRIAEQVEVRIVVATGLYTYNDVPMYFHFRGPGTALDGPEPMVDMFVGDVTEGIAGTGVKAAILKCATDEAGLTPGVERALRAVARAHRATGVPISTHTHARSERGFDQQRVFAEEGVDLSRVVIGHSGDTTDLAYLERLIEAGSYLGMDRFGVDAVLPFDERVATVAALCERGHAERLVLSHDAACANDWLPRDVVAQAMPNWHYAHISRDVVPALKARGVTDDQMRRMLVDNPRAIFERQGGY